MQVAVLFSGQTVPKLRIKSNVTNSKPALQFENLRLDKFEQNKHCHRVRGYLCNLGGDNDALRVNHDSFCGD